MKRAWALWTLLALGLHALPLGWCAVRWAAPTLQPPSLPDAPELEVELETSPVAGSSPSDGSPPGAPGPPSSPRLARLQDGPVAARSLPAQVGLEAAPAEPSTAPDDAVSERVPAPGLSLDALGVGQRNPFVGSDLARAAAAPNEPQRPSAQERFERSLADSILRAEHGRSLGPSGPVLSALIQVTRNSEAPANASARFRCKVDATGKLVSVELTHSDSDPRAWRRVARRVLQALASRVLRLPQTGRGATFDVKVVSRQTLPSGADPGTEVSVLGIPLQRGDGPRSTKVEILNPVPRVTVNTVTLPSGQTADLPSLSVGNILAVAGDPADIGAPAQRVVHAHVESMSASE